MPLFERLINQKKKIMSICRRFLKPTNKSLKSKHLFYKIILIDVNSDVSKHEDVKMLVSYFNILPLKHLIKTNFRKKYVHCISHLAFKSVLAKSNE